MEGWIRMGQRDQEREQRVKGLINGNVGCSSPDEDTGGELINNYN